MQFFRTAVYHVTVWRHSRLRAHWLLALVGGGGSWGRSLLSMGGVCGRSLTTEKIFFTGRQTWSLYLVLWLCDLFACMISDDRRVIILNRASMFAFQWREFSPPLNSAHRLLQSYHRQKRDRRRCNSRGIPLSPPPIGSLANERAVPCDVTLWRCTLRSERIASLSSRSLVRYAPSI